MGVEEHKGSTIRNHDREQHGRDPSDIHLSFKIFRKCQSKFDCLISEMLFIKDLKPTLNKLSDSIRAELFICCRVFYISFIFLLFFSL